MNVVNITKNIDNVEKAACNEKNFDIKDNHEHKMKNIDVKNLYRSEEYTDIEQNFADNLESINIEENHVNKRENIDIEQGLTCSVVIIDEENPASNLENINIEENLVNKMENIDIEEILTSKVEIIDDENPASNLENINIEENPVYKIEYIDESLTSSVENIDEENPARERESNVENSDSEENWVDIEENCDPEETNGHDMVCTCMEDIDIEAKIARFITTESRFKEDFKSSLHKFRKVRELFQTTCFNQDYMSSESGQLFMALMQKIDTSTYFISNELLYWDHIHDLTRRELYTLMTHRFPQVYEELSKVMKYLRKIEELTKKF